MVAIKSVAHFSIPVSDVAKSTGFYTEIVGCRHLALHAGAVNAADVIHPIDDLAAALVDVCIKRLSKIA